MLFCQLTTTIAIILPEKNVLRLLSLDGTNVVNALGLLYRILPPLEISNINKADNWTSSASYYRVR